MQDPTISAGERPAEFRYGAVLILTLVVVVFVIVAPADNWSNAVALALQSASLVVVVATSRVRADLRRNRVLAAACAASALVLAVALGRVPDGFMLLGGGILSIAVPLALVGGLARLVRAHGVTVQAVTGTLAIYLLVGLLFAWVIGFAGHVDPNPFFANGSEATPSSRTYYSFTVLTTTGFGDLTAATQVGHALAVVEMLVGQLYLVTVIGVVIGSFGRRR